MAQFSTLFEHQAYFFNEMVCMKYLEKTRWNGAPCCPHCGSVQHYRVKTRFKNPEMEGYKDFLCKDCKQKYTTLTGTIYQSSKLSLRTWFAAVYLMTSHKKGVSSYQIARDLGVTQKTAWFMMHRIRAMIVEKRREQMEGVVQADETFVGGKNKNRHHNKKVEKSQGRSFKDKTPVMGLLSENQYDYRQLKNGKMKRYITVPSQVVTRAVASTAPQYLQPIIREFVKPGSSIVSDEWVGYTGSGGIAHDYFHHVVDHGAKQYVNGEGFTSNAIEGHWSQFKRGIIGIYHSVSRKHMDRYNAEFDYRHNKRLLDNGERFEVAVSWCDNTRLSYRSLVGVKPTK